MIFVYYEVYTNDILSMGSEEEEEDSLSTKISSLLIEHVMCMLLQY